MQLEVIEDSRRLASVTPEWRDLLSRSASRDFFLLPEWCQHWWATFGHGSTLRTLAAWDDGRLIGLLPLYKQRIMQCNRLLFLGQPRHSDRVDLLADPGREAECFALMAEALSDMDDWDLLSLRNFSVFTGNADLAAEALRKAGLDCFIQEDEHFLYIPLEQYGSYDAYRDFFSSKVTRRRYRRKRKRLESLPGMEWREERELGQALIDEIEDLDRNKSLRGRKHDCFFSQEGNAEFLQRVFTDPVLREHTSSITLRAQGELVAYRLDFLLDRRAMAYQIAYNDAYSVHSPGTMLLLHTIRRCFEGGVAELDFLREGGTYKNRYANTFRTSTRLSAYRGNPKSKALAFYHRNIKPLRKRLGQQDWVERVIPKQVRSRYDI
ncbi:MAG: GNAT family N-acetyltransferase [Desulfocurvibacter africanus]